MPYPNINAERSRMGLTIEELAEKLGVTRKTVYNWMVRGNIPQSKLEAMSSLFNCSIDYLLKKNP
jgi:transcriptional regulator with XRE-family HTH domain